MRVVAGTHRGHPLRAPRGGRTRPTSDRVREALFSILGDAVPDAEVLDLFAGSGALGIEALSRGAARATFVERSPAALAAIAANLAALRLHDRSQVVGMPVARALACAPVCARQYDLVLIDPPYRMASALGPQLSSTLPAILAPGARVVTESDRRSPLRIELPLQRERQYSETLIRIHGNSGSI